MKRIALWLVLALLCIGGCFEIRTDEGQGRIEISGGEVDVNRAIRQLMADRGWTHERAGSHTSSTSSVRTGFGVSTRKGVTLPGGSREESSQSYVHARTANGKIVQFDVDRATGQPTVVRIHAEEGARVSIPRLVADLSQRLRPKARSRAARGPLTIRIDLPAGKSVDPNAISGVWTAQGDWSDSSSHIQFEIGGDGEPKHRHSIHVEGSAPWRTSGGGDEGPFRFRLDRHAGFMLFEGQRWSGGGDGTVTFEPNEAYLEGLAGLVNVRPNVDDALTLFFRDLDLDYARRIKQSLGGELTLADLLKLSGYSIPADYVEGIRAAGYAFPVGQIIKLRSYHVPVDVLQGFKRAGYDFSADELIRIRSYHVTVEDFTAFRDAGHDFSIDEMIKAKSYHLPAEMARTLHEADFRYDLDQLLKLRSYHVPPEYMIAFKRAGYDLSVDEIIKARSYHLDAGHAARFKEADYDFSLDELIKLKSYHVPVEFIVQVHDPRYENFTVQELLDFHQKRIGAETINKIRAAKRQTQP